MASVRQVQVTFDCAAPRRVGRFWCEVLGYVAPPPPEGFASWEDADRAQAPEDRDSWFVCSDPTGAGPRLFFQRVPEGKVGKNRLHLDLSPSDQDQDAEVRRVLELGARHADVGQTGDEPWVCLADPEGNEFCVQ